ncbi:C4-dicarboxylate ABC transporter [Caenimonas koreensis DSM 17982]|uniref:C4-dicarboxylate ABC transporter n=1 Tax=Caenimonas koreensis DSM 17982 TaxID=1121255 RepID=A0A844BH36_9BURK|nr:TRAP transporter substrate-binding protein [Caenimonas koreensis]MRD49751.1 C4-dicarboxylate ABC transporter [Caenimonas koreensis DSM 17982]
MFNRTKAVIATVATCFMCFGALAQDKNVALRISTWVPAQQPLNPTLQAWADDIKKQSGGTLTFTLFPAEQLGKAFDHYDMARDGIADITWVNPGYQPGRFPIIGAAQLPLYISNAKAGSAAINEWYQQYAATEMKDVQFCMAFTSDPAGMHSRKKIVLPTDVKGMKIRPANAMLAQFVTTLGGTNVQASAPELRDLLERGVADSVMFPWGSVVLFGLDKVAKYHIDFPMFAAPTVLVMNKEKYKSLSVNQKKAIDDHCTSTWAEKVATPWADFEAAGKPKVAAQAGHEIVEMTPEQVQIWRTAAQPVEAAWAEGVKKVGGDPKQILDSLKKTLAKYKSAL